MIVQNTHKTDEANTHSLKTCFLYSSAMLFCHSPHVYIGIYRNTHHFSENIILRASIFAISGLYLATSPQIIICIRQDYDAPLSKTPQQTPSTFHKQNETNLIIHALLGVFPESINSSNLNKITEKAYACSSTSYRMCVKRLVFHL